MEMEKMDAISMLMADHKRVQQLFDEFKEIEDDTSMDEEKADLVEQICMELTLHAQLESEIFYPAMRKAIEDQELIDEADVEHDTAKYLISQLESMEPGDDHFEAKVCVLAELVNHHIEEEQNNIFPQAKKADMNLNALGDTMRKRKEALMDNLNAPPSSGSKGKRETTQSRPGAHH